MNRGVMAKKLGLSKDAELVLEWHPIEDFSEIHLVHFLIP